MGIGFGLVTALSWGWSNFLAKRMIDQIGLRKTLFYSFLVGSLFLSLFFILDDPKTLRWSIEKISVSLLASVLSLLGFLSIYHGFKVGSLSVVATISAGWAVVTVSLSLFILGEAPQLWQKIGIFLTIGGVMLVAFRRFPRVFGQENKKSEKNISQENKRLGVFPAACSVLFFGSCYFLMKFVTEDLGPILPILIARSLGILVIGGLLWIQRELGFLPVSQMGTLSLIGVLDATGFVAFNKGIGTTMVSLVSPAASLLTLVTVLLARFYLGEKLGFIQQVGVWLTLFGVFLLSISKGS
jgi:drug/metabolite transporter (DMT)-like permease